jgi:large subunit ribosomal protein L4
VRNLQAEEVESLTLSDDIFAAPVSPALMHQAVVRILAAQRQGTRKAKSRGEVRGGGEKPWRQKGTGRARQGSRTSPIWTGGGVAFPPLVRGHDVRMPKKMRRQAIRSALSSRVADGGLMILNSLVPQEPRTRIMTESFEALHVDGKVLLVDEPIQEATRLSTRNLPFVALKPASTLNIVDVLQPDWILFSVDALKHLESRLTNADV